MPAMKRKSLEFAEPDNKMVKKLAELTIPKLCIRLNTLCVSSSYKLKPLYFSSRKAKTKTVRLCVYSVLMNQYIQRQISATEDGIRNSLTLVRSSLEKRSSKLFFFLFIFDGCRLLKCALVDPFDLYDLVSEIEANEAEEENSLTHSEAVDELFATTYDSLRETNANCITKTRDLIGKLIESLTFI